MSDSHQYFSVETTALQIRKSGAIAIYCGDAPQRNEKTGGTMHQMRGPLLMIPNNGMWTNQQEVAEKISAILNQHAHHFFESAKCDDDFLAAEAAGEID